MSDNGEKLNNFNLIAVNSTFLRIDHFSVATAKSSDLPKLP